MKHGQWLTAKDVLRVNAFKWPEKTGIKDLYKSCSFRKWDERSCRLANVLYEMGLRKGDRFAVLAYNCLEWMEIYGAAAKGGFICVPIMFRPAAPEMEYIINHCEPKAFIVQGGKDPSTGREFPFINLVNGMKRNIPKVEQYISFSHGGEECDGYISYEKFIAGASSREPSVKVGAEDIWVLLYTSVTTGRPKGVMKSHGNLLSQFFIMMHEHNFTSGDTNLMVMPCCHSNSIKYSFAATWAGGTVMTYNMTSFNPEPILKTISEHGITFTSLEPTHYVMLLSLPDEIKSRYNLNGVRKLLSSGSLMLWVRSIEMPEGRHGERSSTEN